jgi:hypothetical protein
MRNRLAGIVTTGVLTLTMSAWPSESASTQADKAPSIAGRWILTTSADGPHGAAEMGLMIKQDGKKVTATFAPPHGGEIPFEGEFVDGTLKLSTSAHGGEAPHATLNAVLKDDGTLAGYLSSERGDMTWNAERVKGGK